MASKTINTLKPLSKVREMNLRSLKLKEESISTLLTTIKSNQKFAKLLIFTLNSLQGFISPPNKEISINASIIIKLDGIEVLHLISVTNINKDEIISLAGDIFYKLISINDVFDKELTKLFAEKNGHKVIIDILLKRKKEKIDDILLPYVKIINALTQIPQLIPTLIENNILDSLNLNLDEDNNKNKGLNYNKNIIQNKLDVIKQISTQKIGREYLINNNYTKKIINLIITCSDKKDVESVLSGLGIIENLCRNEEGKKELKNSGIIDCLSYIFNLLGYEQSIIKMGAKIYCKVASSEDLKAQLEFELCLMLKEEDNFELLKNMFIHLQNINLEDKSKDFINLFISISKNFMNIFYLFFALVPEYAQNNEELMKYILNSIIIIWNIVSNNIQDKNILIIFNSYFTSYGEIFNQYFKNNKGKLNSEISNNLLFINKNILISGEKYLNINENNINPHRIACILMKISSEISIKEVDNINEKKEELIQSLEECYPYLEFLFIKMEDEEILCYSLDLIYDLVISKKDFKENKLNQIIFKICEFMINKSNQRYPCLQCMKLLDIIIGNEQDVNKDQKQKIKYIDSIINVMAFKVINDDNNNKLMNIENEINILGNKILEKLLNEDDFNKLLKEFIENAGNFEPNKTIKDLIETLVICIRRMIGIMD